MIENLNLTRREEKLLRHALSSGQSETVGQLFKREGFRPFLWLGITVAALIGLLLAEVVWYRWLTEEGGFIWFLLALFVFEAVLSPFRFRDEQARARLIRKLYHSLESRGHQAPSGDQ